MRVWSSMLIGAMLMQCTGSATGTLELTAKPTRTFDDGESVEISIRATDAQGKVGSGAVSFTASAGVIGESPVRLDSFGLGMTTFSCDVEADPGCVGSVVVTATWNGAIAELPVRVARRCPFGSRCDGQCVAVERDWFHCGGCGIRCQTSEKCVGGSCVDCQGDCDDDGWSVADGDCCDQYNVCSRPASVNPGAVEARANGIDDNCNGLLDDADTLDVMPCDANLGPMTSDPMDFARALGLCRTTTEGERTWGVLSAELLLADGESNVPPESATLRPVFGTIAPLEGSRLVVFATGPATDANQVNPGLSTTVRQTSANLSTCTNPTCVKDWLSTSRPPLKEAGKLPSSPNCSGGAERVDANDSVMLRLRLRAPTNAKSFRLNTRFFSLEYPQFVCSSFNDQLVLLIDTPGAIVSNPPDKNLMTYSSDGGNSWPVGVNLAAGTPLFQTCDSKASNPTCWSPKVDERSCQLGRGDLALTQYDSVTDGGCLRGGGTRWLGTRGNVKPGGIVELRAVIWDVGDHAFDSLVLMDGFAWAVDEVEPGTDVD